MSVVPSRDTSNNCCSQWIEKQACSLSSLSQTLQAPRDTSPPDYERASAGKDSTPCPVDWADALLRFQSLLSFLVLALSHQPLEQVEFRRRLSVPAANSQSRRKC